MKIPFYVITLLSFSFLIAVSSCQSDNSEGSSGQNTILETGWYHVVDSTAANAVEIQLDRTDKKYYLNPNPGITIKHIQEAFMFSGMTSEEGVKMPLNDEGRRIWTEVTKSAARKYMGFVIDNKLIVTQRIPGRDDGGQTIFFKKEYSKAEMEAIAAKLNEGIKAAGGGAKKN